VYDIENVCFVCEISKQEFNNAGLSFATHTRKVHYLWNYVYYIIGLLEKDPSEYTGIESYIALKYQSQEIDWIPYQKTALLKKRTSTQDENRDLRIIQIEDKLTEIIQILNPQFRSKNKE
jgi:hypothetical protein